MNREDTKIIRVTPETHERLTKHGRKGETYNQIITRLLEEPEFVEKAEKVLKKANEAQKIHQKNGTKWVAIEISFRELLGLLESYIEELRKR